MLSMKPRPVQYGASMRCTQSRDSASGRSRVASTPKAYRLVKQVAGNVRGVGVLRNPAYRGVACFGKTSISGRTRVMRPQRRRGTTTPSTTAGHQRPREEWIEIPVPALVTEENFARAQELLYQNKIRSRRRTIAPSVVQGLVSCAKCGYALSRTSTQTSARKIHYYKCIGSDSWRKLGGPLWITAASSDKNSSIRSSGLR